MYELVKTSKQQKDFENTWEYFCEYYGWYNDPYALNGVRYNLLLPGMFRKQVIGTVEFIPYDPKNKNSTVEGKFSFSSIKEIKENQQRVWEIDKLCLHKDYHRQGYFNNFMEVFYEHAKVYRPKYYIGLMEKRFFRMVRILFQIEVEQKGEALVGPTTALVPVMIDIEKIINDEKISKRLFNHQQYSYHNSEVQTFSYKNVLLLMKSFYEDRYHYKDRFKK